MTEVLRHQWSHTNHACAAIHDTMTKVTNLSLLLSEQQVEKGKTRKELNYKGLLTLLTGYPHIHLLMQLMID